MKWKSLFLLVITCISLSTYAQDSTEAKSDSAKKVRYAAIPIINYNRSLGLVAGAMGSMYYKVNKKDTISPSSSTMLMGIYTTSKSSFGLAVQQLYLNEDRWRIKVIAGTGQIFFQYFQGLPGFTGGYGSYNDNGIWIDYQTNMVFFRTDVKRQIVPHFYGGLEATISRAKTEFDIKNPITGEKYTQEADINMLGYNLLYDNRDHVNYPTQGYFIQFSNNFIREGLGASSDYENYKMSFNYFWDIKNNEKSILVPRVFADISAGDVPFQGENTIGGDDLRGYTQGKYRGKQIYAIQAELRQHLYKKFGMVAFLGAGTATNEFSEIGHSEFLPSVGVGVRYRMIEKEKINVGIDVGAGKDDWSLSFRIGETFGR